MSDETEVNEAEIGPEEAESEDYDWEEEDAPTRGAAGDAIGYATFLICETHGVYVGPRCPLCPET